MIKWSIALSFVFNIMSVCENKWPMLYYVAKVTSVVVSQCGCIDLYATGSYSSLEQLEESCNLMDNYY